MNKSVDLPTLQQVLEDYCYEVLVYKGGNKAATARALGVSKVTLYRYLQKRSERLLLEEAKRDEQHTTGSGTEEAPASTS
jgi:hypothetical protein